MLAVLRRGLPLVVRIEAATWLERVMVQDVRPLLKRPFRTMLVATVVAVEVVVVVESVVVMVTVLVMRVVSVMNRGEVVVVDVVSVWVDVLVEIDVTVIVVDGADAVIVWGKTPTHEHAEVYLAKLVHADAYAGNVEPEAVTSRFAGFPLRSTVRVVAAVSVTVKVSLMVAVASEYSVLVVATIVSTDVKPSTTVAETTTNAGTVTVLSKVLVAGVTVTRRYVEQSRAPLRVVNAEAITAGGLSESCRLMTNNP